MLSHHHEYGPELSIIIVSYNTRDLLAGCLASLFAIPSEVYFDVWVVDNASDDGSCQMVRRTFPQVHLIASSENLGYGKANNLAIKRSCGGIVLLLNSDTLVSPGVLDTTYNLLKRRKDIGALGCKLLGTDGQPQFSYNVSYPSGPTVGTLGATDEDGLVLCAYVWGAYLMVKREVIDTVGPFDERFFMFYEDVEWCWRMVIGGWNIGYYPDCSIIHISQASCDSVGSRKRSMWMVTSETILYAKHHSTIEVNNWRLRRMVHHGWCGLCYRLINAFKRDDKLRDKIIRHESALSALVSYSDRKMRGSKDTP